MVGGIIVLVGWVLDISLLKRVSPGLVAMKVNTALAFLLAGISLWFACADRRHKKQAITSISCAIGVLLIGTLSAFEYSSGVDVGIDQLLIREQTMLPGDIPGRMALVTAINFSLLGTGLLLVGSDNRLALIVLHLLALIVATISASGLVGYAYSTEVLYRIRHVYTAMALHTSAIFLILALGMVNARPDFPLRRILAGSSAAGIATRQLLVAAIVFPFVAGLLVINGYRAGCYGDALALSIFAVTNMAGLGLLVLWNSVLLFKAERLRDLAEKELRTNEAELEAIVARCTEDLNKTNAALAQEARFDYLTGLCNRRYFMEQADAELSRARRFDNQLAVLVLDIDHFKRVNDTYGHQCGDSVLSQLGALLRKTFREVDIVGRIGGEEFAVTLPQTGRERAVEAAERIRQLLAAMPVVVENRQSITCTVSIGVATLNPDDNHIDQLLHRADLALYEAKRSGRNRVLAG